MDSQRDQQGRTEAEFLAAYDPTAYDRPSVTVDMVIFTVTSEAEQNYRKLPGKELKLLLIKRGEHPALGSWALPGGFVGMSEGLDEAAARTLKRETGIAEIYLEQLYTWGEPQRDPRTRVISASYLSLVDAEALTVRAGADANDARWFSVTEELLEESRSPKEGLQVRKIRLEFASCEERLAAVVQVTTRTEGRLVRTERTVLESEGIAFDHARIIQYGLERLRSKIEWTDIAFNLMPELFTLSELQQVYEVILRKELLTANFRRKIAPLVIETNQFRKDAGHRPAKLYRFNPAWVESGF